MSTGFIMSDSPWESNIEVGSPQARNEAKLRYKEKKIKHTWVLFSFLIKKRYKTEFYKILIQD